MSTKSYTFIPHHLQDHNVQSWQKSFFPLRPKGTTEFWSPKKPFKKVDILVSKWVRFMSPRSHIQRRVEHWEKNHFPQGDMLKNTYKGRFLTIKKDIQKILGLKIQTVKTCSSASSTHTNFYLKKTLKSRFLVVFQSFVFGQILANFGNFGQNLLHW
jgi:hypothetical protein